MIDVTPNFEPLPPPSPASRDVFYDEKARLVGTGILMSMADPLVLLDNSLSSSLALITAYPQFASKAEQAKIAIGDISFMAGEEFHEIALVSEPNGDTRAIVKGFHAHKAVHPKRLLDRDTYGHDVNQKLTGSVAISAVNEIVDEIEVVNTYYKSKDLGFAYKAIGLRFSRKSEGGLTYPSEIHLQENLAWLAEKTGFAPRVKTLPKGELDGIDVIGTLADEAAIAVSGSPKFRIHDLTVHLPVWVTQHEETFQVFADNAEELMRNYRAAGSPETGPTRDAIAVYTNSLDSISTAMLEAKNKWETSRRIMALALFPNINGQLELIRKENEATVLNSQQRALVDYHLDLFNSRITQLRAINFSERDELLAAA